MDKLLHGFDDDWYKHVGSSSRLRVWSNSLRDVSRFVSGSLSSSCIRTQLLRVKRRLQLEAALQAEGCELRTDSGLCHAFVQDGVGDPKAIATTMAVRGRRRTGGGACKQVGVLRRGHHT